LQLVQRVWCESVHVRSGKYSDSRRPITCGQRARAASTWLHADRWSQRKRIAGGELSTGQSPEPADQVRGSAAEDPWEGEAAGHSKIASRAGSAGSDPQPSPGRYAERGVRRPPLSPDLYREVRPGNRDDPFVFEFQLGAFQRDLERRRFSRVAHERIGQAMRPRIHWSGGRHSSSLQPPSSGVLHRRQ
jgi:hypothetical protein